MEECAEVQHRASKALLFGLHDVESGESLDNIERLEVEYNDLLAIIGMLNRHGVSIQSNESAQFYKTVKVSRYIDEYLKSKEPTTTL